MVSWKRKRQDRSDELCRNNLGFAIIYESCDGDFVFGLPEQISGEFGRSCPSPVGDQRSRDPLLPLATKTSRSQWPKCKVRDSGTKVMAQDFRYNRCCELQPRSWRLGTEGGTDNLHFGLSVSEPGASQPRQYYLLSIRSAASL